MTHSCFCAFVHPSVRPCIEARPRVTMSDMIHALRNDAPICCKAWPGMDAWVLQRLLGAAMHCILMSLGLSSSSCSGRGESLSRACCLAFQVLQSQVAMF
jgi:hypothetical protein